MGAKSEIQDTFCIDIETFSMVWNKGYVKTPKAKRGGRKHLFYKGTLSPFRAEEQDKLISMCSRSFYLFRSQNTTARGAKQKEPLEEGFYRILKNSSWKSGLPAYLGMKKIPGIFRTCSMKLSGKSIPSSLYAL